MPLIDTTFDFRTDTRPGKDPDWESATLRGYHRVLWGRPLPSGASFELADGRPNGYLVHRSELGEFWLGSDAVVPSFGRKAAKIVAQLDPGELEAFNTMGYTIGAMMVFPANRVDRKMTINGARGFHPRIADRFDLTVECIRRFYVGEESPLSVVLERYNDFFRLFGDFAGYVDHFLLQDLVNDDASEVRFALPFADFTGPPVPQDLATYRGYRDRCVAFIVARNRRIGVLAEGLFTQGDLGGAR